MKDPPETWDGDALLFQIPMGKRLLEIVPMKVYPRKLQLSDPVTLKMFSGSSIGLKIGKKHIMPG